MKFAFENLEVYQRSIQLNQNIETILKREKQNLSRSLTDQLTRAALSIPLNIAEGNGRWHKGDKRNFLWIARGSTFECIPIIHIMNLNKVITKEEKLTLRNQLEVIGKMLTNLIKAHEQSQ